MDAIKDFSALFQGKTILVTGAAGTVGRVLIKNLVKYSPSSIRALDISEYGLFELEKELKSESNENNVVRYLIGNITDKDRMKKAMHSVDIVFHTAALKHVKLSEYNAFEAVKTNIIGMQNVIDTALEADAEKVIFTSTDKAANPVSLMGTTKLLGEKLITAGNYYHGKSRTIFASVRFGNILGSSGSVIPIFRKQIKRKNEITVTDPSMTRFFMTENQAADMIFKTAETMKGGEVFILKMPVFRLGDLAEIMASATNARIKIIGKLSGEKLHEELMTKHEAMHAIETPNMFVLLPEIKEFFPINSELMESEKKAELRDYSSKDFAPVSKQELEQILKSANLI